MQPQRQGEVSGQVGNMGLIVTPEEAKNRVVLMTLSFGLIAIFISVHFELSTVSMRTGHNWIQSKATTSSAQISEQWGSQTRYKCPGTVAL